MARKTRATPAINPDMFQQFQRARKYDKKSSADTNLPLFLHRTTNSDVHLPVSWSSGDILPIRPAKWNIYHFVPKITLSRKCCLNGDKTRAALPPNGECLMFQSRAEFGTHAPRKQNL